MSARIGAQVYGGKARRLKFLVKPEDLPALIAHTRLFDLDHIGTLQRQLICRHRPGDGLCKINNLDAFECEHDRVPLNSTINI